MPKSKAMDPAQSETSQKLYTVQEAASFLGVSSDTLRRWDAKGVLIPYRTAGNQRRYTYEQLQSFLKRPFTRPVLGVEPLTNGDRSVVPQPTIGSAAIETDQTAVEVSTPAASKDSRIFLTPTTLTSRQLTVTAKDNGKFKVEIEEADSKPITFDWWIVN